jgi:hypothetical protein
MADGSVVGFGAIAQLGERLICIQEVVGSIPSGSTNCLVGDVAGGGAFWFVWTGLRGGFAASLVLCHREEGMHPIGRKAGGTQVSLWSGVFGKQMVFLSVFVAAERRTPIMRTIKCLKGIRWMPWRW